MDRLQVSIYPTIATAEWKNYGLAVLIRYPQKLFADLFVVDDNTGDTHEYRVYSAWLNRTKICLS